MSVFIIGNGKVSWVEGPRGTTPPSPGAKFKVRDVVRVRRLKHLRDLPEIAAIVTVIPPNFSPDWAWADTLGKPRPLMCRVGSRKVTYIVAFDGGPSPYLMQERYLLPTNQPPAVISFAPEPKP
jgi:hypothetical protein